MKNLLNIFKNIVEIIKLPIAYMSFVVSLISGYLVYLDEIIVSHIQFDNFLEICSYVFIFSTIISLSYLVFYLISTINVISTRKVLLKYLTNTQKQFIYRIYNESESSIDVSDGHLCELIHKGLVIRGSTQIVNQAFHHIYNPCYLPDWVKKYCKKNVGALNGKN